MELNLSLVITTFVTFLLSSAHSSALECTFKSNTWSIYDSDRQLLNQTELIRYCEVSNKEIFVNFIRVEGCASCNEDLSKVTGFVFTHGTMNYFPHGIDKIFNHLTAIQVEEAKLREIHVEDLAGFKNLKILYLNSNDLRVIETDLFKFNEKLEVIRLDFNDISHFDPQVFNHLVNLRFLSLKENKCKVGNAVGGDEVRNLIKLIENDECIDYDQLKVTNGQERILRILDKNEEQPDDDEINSLKLKISEVEKKFREISTENENLNLKIEKFSLENKILSEKLNKVECNDDELRACQSDVVIKSLEIARLQKVIEQLENNPPSFNKFSWRDILVPSVIGLLTLVTVIIGIIVIVVKINFIIQKLKDQFHQTARRPLNVPNDFWHHEE